MLTIHKISEELFVDSFDLIALHCTMESYALAYHINKMVNIALERAKDDLEINANSYPLYAYRNEVNDQEWALIMNKIQEEESDEGDGLFQNSTTIKAHYLLEERKEINYLLKVSPSETLEIEKTIDAIRTIPKITMAYQLNTDSLKSKRNLIF